MLVEAQMTNLDFDTLDQLFFVGVPIVDSEVRERFRRLWYDEPYWKNIKVKSIVKKNDLDLNSYESIPDNFNLDVYKSNFEKKNYKKLAFGNQRETVNNNNNDDDDKNDDKSNNLDYNYILGSQNNYGSSSYAEKNLATNNVFNNWSNFNHSTDNSTLQNLPISYRYSNSKAEKLKLLPNQISLSYGSSILNNKAVPTDNNAENIYTHLCVDCLSVRRNGASNILIPNVSQVLQTLDIQTKNIFKNKLNNYNSSFENDPQQSKDEIEFAKWQQSENRNLNKNVLTKSKNLSLDNYENSSNPFFSSQLAKLSQVEKVKPTTQLVTKSNNIAKVQETPKESPKVTETAFLLQGTQNNIDNSLNSVNIPLPLSTLLEFPDKVNLTICFFFYFYYFKLLKNINALILEIRQLWSSKSESN